MASQKTPCPTLGPRLAARRKAVGLTLQDLALRAHIGARELALLEADPMRGTNTRVLKALCEALHCSADWLLGLTLPLPD